MQCQMAIRTFPLMYDRERLLDGLVDIDRSACMIANLTQAFNSHHQQACSESGIVCGMGGGQTMCGYLTLLPKVGRYSVILLLQLYPKFTNFLRMMIHINY